MKGLGTRIRFVAVSATVPNIEDVALWLGLGHHGIQPNHGERESPSMARVLKFGDEFRPCPLQKSLKHSHTFHTTC